MYHVYLHKHLQRRVPGTSQTGLQLGSWFLVPGSCTPACKSFKVILFWAARRYDFAWQQPPCTQEEEIHVERPMHGINTSLVWNLLLAATALLLYLAVDGISGSSRHVKTYIYKVYRNARVLESFQVRWPDLINLLNWHESHLCVLSVHFLHYLIIYCILIKIVFLFP